MTIFYKNMLFVLLIFTCSVYVVIIKVTTSKKPHRQRAALRVEQSSGFGNKTHQHSTPTNDAKNSFRQTCSREYSLFQVCDISMISPEVSGEFPGTLVLNGAEVFEWTHAVGDRYAHVFGLNAACHVTANRSFTIAHTGPQVPMVTEYVTELENATLLVGTFWNPRVMNRHILSLLGLAVGDHVVPTQTRARLVFISWRYGGQSHTLYDFVRSEPGSVAAVYTTWPPEHRFPYSTNSVTYDMLAAYHTDVSVGGHWIPRGCDPPWSVALIIPYRNREQHLRMFLNNMISFLKLQQIQFTIFVVEQASPEIFNRAALMNIGYLEAQKSGSFDCYIFHDVDMVPENLMNIYECNKHPRHLVVTRSVTGYKVRNDQKYVYFGGAIALTRDHVEAINGFPNTFFGWGGEDDEILGRIQAAGMPVVRYSAKIGAYYCFSHNEDPGNPHIHRAVKILKEYARTHHKVDGLNSVNYEVMNISRERLYTNITARVPGPRNDTELAVYLEETREVMYQSMIKGLLDRVQRVLTDRHSFNDIQEESDFRKWLEQGERFLIKDKNT